jgi:2-dehydro-3-deoxy-D-gluconate 5-dehydrogenase
MILDSFRLSGKTALVTGASTGIGQAIAAALAQAGADIAGVYHNAPCAATADLVRQAGRSFYPIQADLSSAELAESIVDEAVAEYGRLDILVNNAGIIRRGPALEFTPADWDAVMDVDLKSLFFLSQAAARQFRRQGTGGKIIQVASVLSFQGGIRVASYTAAKSGVMGLTRLLANEWAQHGINVNAIVPGYTITDNNAVLRQDEKRSAEILARIPAGRWALPEDMAGAAIFLASAASDYVHGAALVVDGGWLAR